MTDIERLQGMIGELRRQRNRCEPKANTNTRYLKYSTAVLAINWVITDLQAEEAALISAQGTAAAS
jgi:hypothetical protein